MPRIVHFRDVDVRLNPYYDISKHEFWLNADPHIPQPELAHRLVWPGYEVRQNGRLIGVVASRSIDYPFNGNDFRDAEELADRSWMLLGSDMTFRRYATSMRGAVERLIKGPPYSIEPETELDGDDLLALEGLV